MGERALPRAPRARLRALRWSPGSPMRRRAAARVRGYACGRPDDELIARIAEQLELIVDHTRVGGRLSWSQRRFRKGRARRLGRAYPLGRRCRFAGWVATDSALIYLLPDVGPTRRSRASGKRSVAPHCTGSLLGGISGYIQLYPMLRAQFRPRRLRTGYDGSPCTLGERPDRSFLDDATRLIRV